MIEFRATVRAYRQVPCNATILAINGREVLGRCEGCNRLIYTDSVCYRWADDVLTCKKCGPPDKESKPISG
jgi:hypothetical protein